jgi:predicted acylesterase/phospholipase RssA
MSARSVCASLLMLGSVLGIAGCAASMARNGIPDPVLAEKADIAGLPSVRYWADEVPADLSAEVRKRLPNMPKLAQGAKRVGGRPVVEILALSGGGNEGAFGAGLLAGWTARGNRPQFEVVTGVSAGAIIAPFAYLGPRYDAQLKKIWTEYRTSELVTAQILPGLLGGPALADTAPLEQLINTYVDKRMLREIAAEYRKGRMLLVGTTNLDAQRPVVWNMGEIAASRHPQAAALFRKVLLASAAIPGAFPPVNITVEADGKRYDEMHVDGATTREVFVLPVQVPFKAFDALYSAPPIRKLYIVKNGKIAPETDVVKEQAIPIAVRAISTLIKSQHMGELYRIYRMAKDANAEFNFVAVPPTFTRKPKELFDPDYQAALFNEGYGIGLKGTEWMKAPPERRAVAGSP